MGESEKQKINLVWPSSSSEHAKQKVEMSGLLKGRIYENCILAKWSVTAVVLMCLIVVSSKQVTVQPENLAENKVWRFGGLPLQPPTFLTRIYTYGNPITELPIKSVNIFAVAIWDPTTKFNSLQYFQLYGTLLAQIRCGITTLVRVLARVYKPLTVLKPGN